MSDDAPAPGRPDYRSAPRLLLRHGRGDRTRLAAAAVLGALAGAAGLAPAWAVWRVVDALVAGDLDARTTWTAAGIALAGVVGKQILFGASTALAHLAAFDVIARMRMALGRAWTRVRVGELRAGHSSTARTAAIDHCEKMELFIAHAVPEITASLTVWLAVTAWLFAVDWRLALATVVLTPVGFALMIRAMRANGHRMGEWMAANGAMGAAIIDFLTAMPVIRVFNRVGEDHRRTTDAVRRNAELQSDWGRAFVPLGSPFSTLTASGIALIAPLSAWLLAAGDVDASTVLLFLILGPTYATPLVGIYGLLTQVPLLSAGAVLIEAELARDPMRGAPDAAEGEVPRAVAGPARDPDAHDGAPISAAAGGSGGGRAPAPEVVFDDVTFTYPGEAEPAVRAVSFTAPAGGVTALVGASGSGKSTLAEILLGFHEPQSGRVLVGGRDVADQPEHERMAGVSAVFQNPHLLAGTIRDNVTLGRPDATDAELDDALRAAAVDADVAALPDGAGTVLGESGSGLSGGQRQRVAIARALLADRPLLVLDEATAATDPDNEALVQEGLTRLAAGRTTLVIAHRLHTVRDADRIVVLDGGRVAEQGDHDSLVAAGGAYARMWDALAEVTR